jgi:hypothetical protein
VHLHPDAFFKGSMGTRSGRRALAFDKLFDLA